MPVFDAQSIRAKDRQDGYEREDTRNGCAGGEGAPTSCSRRDQAAHSDKVVDRRRKGEHPSHPLGPAIPGLTQRRDSLDPTEHLLDQWPFSLTHRITRMPCRSDVNATRPPILMLRDMRSHVAFTQLLTKSAES